MKDARSILIRNKKIIKLKKLEIGPKTFLKVDFLIFFFAWLKFKVLLTPKRLKISLPRKNIKNSNFLGYAKFRTPSTPKRLKICLPNKILRLKFQNKNVNHKNRI